MFLGMRNLVIIALCVPLLSSAQTRAALIRGVVLDPSEAVIVGARVQVFSEADRCETTSDEQGKFICRLPPGNYAIRAASSSFFPYRRASITLNAGANIFVSIRTVPGPTRGIDVKGGVVEPGTPVSHDGTVLADGTDVVVRFHEVEKKDGRSTFTGPYLMLSAGRLAMYADKLICTEHLDTCTASGSVLVELGEEQITGTELEIDLKTRKLLLRREPTVVRAF